MWLSKAIARYRAKGSSSRLPGHLPGNCKVPGSMPSWGFLLLLFPLARNFTPIASATQLLNWENIVYIVYQDTAEKQLHKLMLSSLTKKSQKSHNTR